MTFVDGAHALELPQTEACAFAGSFHSHGTSAACPTTTALSINSAKETLGTQKS